ncbi:tRNA (N6-threonylcarbamoyladenosine(37)-N6)-methyltransferase TrmO [Notoacmeibacter ruber]|nr:tRNA (N6-threonylcarbamoyladenosine(37)-N6)-methyltransferase TrmO [Notoacmeibacter ruber]
MAEFEQRQGEARLPFDPAERKPDAGLVFIGKVSSPWLRREDCPKNLRQARERDRTASIIIEEPYRPALAGLRAGDYCHVLSWLHHAPRDLISQKPRHLETAKGTFALRSPVRPNPIGLHTVRIVSLDHQRGTIEMDAIDLLDGTPVLDLKPYYPSIDAFAEASGGAKD